LQLNCNRVHSFLIVNSAKRSFLVRMPSCWLGISIASGKAHSLFFMPTNGHHNFARKMTLHRLALSCLLVAIFSTAAHADTWIYDFSGTNSALGGNGLSVAFQYSTQGPITTNTSLLSSQLISCTNCLVSSLVPAVVFQPSNVFGSSVQFNDLGNVANEYMFPLLAFSNPGTYISTSPFNSGTLTVQVVPEPSSIILFLSGLGIVSGIARRKLG